MVEDVVAQVLAARLKRATLVERCFGCAKLSACLGYALQLAQPSWHLSVVPYLQEAMSEGVSREMQSRLPIFHASTGILFVRSSTC